MQYGVIFPTTEIGSDPGLVRAFAQTAEQLGCRRLLAFDHVLGAVPDGRTPPLTGPYTHEHPFHEPMVLFGHLAACTTSITLATCVLVLPQRQTVLVAKQAAEVDLLSAERLVLGVGIGWNPVEYEALGVAFRQRGSRLEEQVHLLRALWSGEVVDVTGDHHRVDRAALAPAPRRQVPIWFGGRSPATMARAARLGDGFTMRSYGEAGRRETRLLLEALAEAGRSPDAFPIERFVDFDGGPERWHDVIAEWEAFGGTYVSLRTSHPERPGRRSPREHLEALETFMAAVT